jgi:serine/threonine-protein kinase PRP4
LCFPASPITSAPSTPREIQDPAAFAVLNKQSPGKANGSSEECEDDGPSAADYDPTMDMKEDKIRDATRHHEEYPSSAYDETHTQQVQDILIPQPDVQQPSIEKPEKDEFDMFGEDDDDDMFAEEKPSEPEAKTQAADSARAVPVAATKVVNNGMIDNWDDPEGYYKVILGELLENRYHVQANLGKGMFSSVVRALDTTTNELVAIKLIRANETMKKAGMKEIEIIQKLNDADKENKKHLIRLERYFEHKGHLCMVFEHLSINLREVLKKFGRDVGINLRAVRIYAQQMLLALSLMRKCNILHADLKPDNMLVNENRSVLKVCDLGSASDATENEITPYLVSRFYRAPEIILGMPYDFAIDIWSVGCTLYELYTGKILFVGRSNNQMLRSIMECRGKFTTKMLKRAEFAYMHFDQNANFLSVEQDKLTGRDTVKTLTFAKPTRDLRTRLLGASKGLSEEEMKDLNLFIDLLDKCLTLNPEKRCTPTEALKHPFISRVGK